MMSGSLGWHPEMPTSLSGNRNVSSVAHLSRESAAWHSAAPNFKLPVHTAGEGFMWKETCQELDFKGNKAKLYLPPWKCSEVPAPVVFGSLHFLLKINCSSYLIRAINSPKRTLVRRSIGEEKLLSNTSNVYQRRQNREVLGQSFVKRLPHVFKAPAVEDGGNNLQCTKTACILLWDDRCMHACMACLHILPLALMNAAAIELSPPTPTRSIHEMRGIHFSRVDRLKVLASTDIWLTVFLLFKLFLKDKQRDRLHSDLFQGQIVAILTYI